MESITAILEKKQPCFNTISPEVSIREALVRMNSLHTDHLIVTDNDDNFLGLLTEHEIVSAILRNNPDPEKTAIGSIINRNLPLADTSDTVEDCMHLMKRFDVRYLPVFEDLHFVGVISSDDILHHAILRRGGIFDEENKNNAPEYSY
jgi:CBS domain-containing protein